MLGNRYQILTQKTKQNKGIHNYDDKMNMLEDLGVDWK
jgi:hypothetical protein